MKRTAILLDKTVSTGEAANISAILMGHLSSNNSELFYKNIILDRSSFEHAGIINSVIVLKAKSTTQIYNFLQIISKQENILYATFTSEGQGLHNAFSDYARMIQESDLAALRPVGAIVHGQDEIIRTLTKRYSLFQ